MTETNKQEPPVHEVGPKKPKPTKTALDDKQLDSVTGDGIYESTTHGTHIPTVPIEP